MINEISVLASILKKAIEQKASDVIIGSEGQPSLKVNGDVVFLEDHKAFTNDQLKELVLNIMTKKQQAKFLENMELDFSIGLGENRFRVNAFKTVKGYAMVFRPITLDAPKFDDLGLPSVIKRFAEKKSGLVLITGAVGTGKSTTMISLVNEINLNKSRHIITVEDPIEYMFKNEKSLIEQREVGSSTLTFENALKYSLRQASDVLMVGEMRDLETFRLALRAAETGNLVFATLHTSGAARTIARIVDMFPSSEKEQVKAQLSESLLGVVWQKLIKKSDGKGRVAAVEIMTNTTSISNTIRKGDNHQLNGIIETSSKDGMISMKRYLDLLYSKEIITEDVYKKEAKVLGNEI